MPFPSSQFSRVPVLPLAWQAAPACFINTAQATLGENPRFSQVQLHSGELHYLQHCTYKTVCVCVRETLRDEEKGSKVG